MWFGLTWSLELYQQTNARLWRQGQQSDTVVVLHIITKGTIDERIMKALSEKDTTQAALIEAVKAEFENLSKSKTTIANPRNLIIFGGAVWMHLIT